ncbi:glycerol-3-phosphate dehydrogenase C-terminal domain-containing protein [Mesorhizobium sp.]|uniref:glycerol-3-phosphate dehydrogenase C-terminal domain-containing protein n=1 Tax=Mesorhizobium sp. TaxID=1871066 RepID=UPI0025E13B60|nr:glycerol-3-phosphate dehydrogenase C-terminal domain-containing protein [Mesorhizobium sp.]
MSRLGQPRRVSTQSLAIGGGRDFPADAAARARWISGVTAETGASPARAEALLDRYGTTARLILAHEAERQAKPLAGPFEYTLAEIDWLARNERVVHLTDIVMRRTALAITGRLSRSNLEQIADAAAAALTWDAGRREKELEATSKELTERHRFCFE